MSSLLSKEKQDVLLPGALVEILNPLLYRGQQGQLLQREDESRSLRSDRWLVVVVTEQETLILSLVGEEFRVIHKP